MALEPLSLRSYARHRKSLGLVGVSLEAVRKAILSERIKDAVVTVKGVKKIADPELADREWAANTDPARAALDEEEDDDEEREPSEIVLATTREKHWRASSAELRFRKDAGELVNAAEMEAEQAALCTQIRNKVLGVTNRMKQAHPDTSLAWLATLDTYLREALEELAAS